MHENHENSRIPYGNHETHENHVNPYENHENHKILEINR